MLATVADLDSGRLDPLRVREAARRAEDGGFDAVYVGDHVLHPRPMLEAVVTLATVAAATTRIAFGPCVLLLALRHPLIIANELATLAEFAPGRLRLGVGVGGEYPAEFDAVGVPLAERGARTTESLVQIRARIRDVPIFLGGSADAALRRAADHGDGWMGYLLGVDSFARRLARLDTLRRQSARANDPFTLGMLLPVHVTHDGGGRAAAAAAWTRLTSLASPLPDRLFIAGTPDDIVTDLDAYRRAGCNELVLTPADHGSGYLQQVDELVGQVLPRLRALDDQSSGTSRETERDPAG